MIFCSITLGCKVNQYETQAIESILTAHGHIRSTPGAGCDVCIINTCTVTAESARKSRQAVRRLKKLEPSALIAVCGCLSQLDPSAVSGLGADITGGSGDRRAFAERIEQKAKNNPEFRIPNSEFEELPPGGAAGRTRALLKIQDGCDNFCAYCIIPYTRGRARSLPPHRAAEFARQLQAQGYLEIVITGIEIISYGKDFQYNGEDHPHIYNVAGEDESEFTKVVRAISAAAPNARLRLGSLDPGAVTDILCNELKSIRNLCAHFHLSLQSGCDETLRRMGRKYGTNSVREALSSLRRCFPDCGITADLITGFPGETDAEFAHTLEFIESAAFSGMHVFPFSPRPGTRAAVMPEQVEKRVRLERAKIASAAAADMARSFRLDQIGKTVEVLFERERAGYWIGRSCNYLEVAAKNGGEKNTIRPVLITEVRGNVVFGEITG